MTLKLVKLTTFLVKTLPALAIYLAHLPVLPLVLVLIWLFLLVSMPVLLSHIGANSVKTVKTVALPAIGVKTVLTPP